MLPTARGTTLVAVALLVIGCGQSDLDGPVGPSISSRSASLSGAPSSSSNGQGPQACMPDSKLLGRYSVSTADGGDSWWELTKERFDAANVTDYRAALSAFYGIDFATLDDAKAYLIARVAAWDANGNGYVCAFEENGTRAHLGDNAVFLIGIADDKHYSP